MKRVIAKIEVNGFATRNGIFRVRAEVVATVSLNADGTFSNLRLDADGQGVEEVVHFTERQEEDEEPEGTYTEQELLDLIPPHCQEELESDWQEGLARMIENEEETDRLYPPTVHQFTLLVPSGPLDRARPDLRVLNGSKIDRPHE